MEEVAADICTHLMEVDWLPEAAKPVLRQAYLSITRYANHIQRELRKYENTRSDVGLEIRNTIMRVQEDHANRARAQALARSLKAHEESAKNERDLEARNQLLQDTEIRLMFHEVQNIEQAIGVAELKATVDVGATELKNIKTVHKVAIGAYRRTAAEVQRAHGEIEARRAQLAQTGLAQQQALMEQTARPNTRGGDGGGGGRRRRKNELEPIGSSSVRPSTAPGGRSKKRRRAKKRGVGGGGGGGGGREGGGGGGREGGGAGGEPKRDKAASLAAWSPPSSSMPNTELRGMLLETAEGVHKYLDDLGRKHRTAIYNKKRRNQRRGAELRAVSQRRLNHRAQKRRNKRPQVFSGEIAKMVEGKIKSTTRRKQFHC